MFVAYIILLSINHLSILEWFQMRVILKEISVSFLFIKSMAILFYVNLKLLSYTYPHKQNKVQSKSLNIQTAK